MSATDDFSLVAESNGLNDDEVDTQSEVMTSRARDEDQYDIFSRASSDQASVDEIISAYESQSCTPAQFPSAGDHLQESNDTMASTPKYAGSSFGTLLQNPSTTSSVYHGQFSQYGLESPSPATDQLTPLSSHSSESADDRRSLSQPPSSLSGASDISLDSNLSLSTNFLPPSLPPDSDDGLSLHSDDDISLEDEIEDNGQAAVFSTAAMPSTRRQPPLRKLAEAIVTFENNTAQNLDAKLHLSEKCITDIEDSSREQEAMDEVGELDQKWLESSEDHISIAYTAPIGYDAATSLTADITTPDEDTIPDAQTALCLCEASSHAIITTIINTHTAIVLYDEGSRALVTTTPTSPKPSLKRICIVLLALAVVIGSALFFVRHFKSSFYQQPAEVVPQEANIATPTTQALVSVDETWKEMFVRKRAVFQRNTAEEVVAWWEWFDVTRCIGHGRNILTALGLICFFSLCVQCLTDGFTTHGRQLANQQCKLSLPIDNGSHHSNPCDHHHLESPVGDENSGIVHGHRRPTHLTELRHRQVFHALADFGAQHGSHLFQSSLPLACDAIPDDTVFGIEGGGILGSAIRNDVIAQCRCDDEFPPDSFDAFLISVNQVGPGQVVLQEHMAHLVGDSSILVDHIVDLCTMTTGLCDFDAADYSRDDWQILFSRIAQG